MKSRASVPLGVAHVQSDSLPLTLAVDLVHQRQHFQWLPFLDGELIMLFWVCLCRYNTCSHDIVLSTPEHQAATLCWGCSLIFCDLG